MAIALSPDRTLPVRRVALRLAVPAMTAAVAVCLISCGGGGGAANVPPQDTPAPGPAVADAGRPDEPLGPGSVRPLPDERAVPDVAHPQSTGPTTDRPQPSQTGGARPRSTTADAPPAPTGTADRAARRFALLVGVAAYDSPDMGDLLYPEDDVTALADVLKAGGYKPEDVIVMCNATGAKDPALLPRADRVMAQLRTLTGRCGPNDLIVVAFAGHGAQPAKGEQYFCGYQAALDDPSTLVAVNDVIDVMGKSPAAMKLLFVDACRDSPGSRTRSGGSPRPWTRTRPRSTGRPG